jgi:hypothetical protein
MGSDSQADGKYESVAYFPHQKRLAETACAPSSQRLNYSLSIRDKNPNFSASNPVNFLEARFWIHSGLSTTPPESRSP